MTDRQLSDLERDVFDAILQHPEGVSIRQIQDELEKPERGSRRIPDKNEVRTPAERLVELDLVTRDKKDNAVTYFPPSDLPENPGAARRRLNLA